jgi:hypothetical protein
MGLPVPFVCSAPECSAVHGQEKGGVFFDVQQLFTKRLAASSACSSQVRDWVMPPSFGFDGGWTCPQLICVPAVSAAAYFHSIFQLVL